MRKIGSLVAFAKRPFTTTTLKEQVDLHATTGTHTHTHAHTYVCSGDKVLVGKLKECGKREDLERGRSLHKNALESGCHTNIYIASALITMYSKCRSMHAARAVFDTNKDWDAVLWTSLLLGYVENGESLIAMELFGSVTFLEPDSITYVAALKACACLGERDVDRPFWLEKGSAIHRAARERELDGDIYVGNVLVSMYSKCGSVEQARCVFEGMRYRNAVTWNTLILGYVENGESLRALELYNRMDCEPDTFTFVSVLKACSSVGKSERRLCIERGNSIYRQAKERGVHTERFVVNALVDMYSKCGSMRQAQGAFDSVGDPDVVLWNSLILGYVENGESLVAMELFEKMRCKPDSITFVGVLKACRNLEKGKALHRQAKERGVDGNMIVESTLVDMYSKCGSMELAREVFENMRNRDVVPWNSLLLGYVENGESLVALEMFKNMDCEPNTLTLVAALKACACLACEKQLEKQVCLEKGIVIHEQAKERGLDRERFLANTLIDMYGKCGSMSHARDVFENMSPRDVVSWTNLILGYVENGESSVAMELLASMDCEWDSITYVAALKACASVVCVGVGREMHGEICRLGLERDQVVVTALVDFYGKCGRMGMAEHLFNSVHSPEIICWNALVSGYTSVGDTPRVFSRLRECGLKMNGVTYLHVLTTCRQAGMVEEGKRYLEYMKTHGVCPSVDHYACVVDMLGRANRLREALCIVESMPSKDRVVWTSLLSACRDFANVEVGKVAFDALVESNKDDSYAYVMMSDIYKKLGMEEACTA